MATRNGKGMRWVSGHGWWVAGVISWGLAGVACQNEQCEAERLGLEKTWETLRDTAISRKQIPEGVDLSDAEQKERIRVWTAIEEKAELIRSSFQTSQVTISPAEKARAELEQLFKPLTVKDDPMTRGFATTLADADRRFQSFRQKCR